MFLDMREKYLAHYLLVLLIGVLASSQLGSSGSVKLLDQEKVNDKNVGSIAKALCEVEGRRAQISRVSTIVKLVEYFDTKVLDSNHALHACKSTHLEALRLLQQVLEVSNENVCSDDKLDLVEEFHENYVSTHEDQVRERRQAGRILAPQLLRLFFMHYAMEVDAWCKRNLINNLEWDLKDKFGEDVNKKLFELESQDNESDQAAFSAVFNGAMKKFTDLYSVEKYEDVLMVWDLIENSYLSQKMAKDELSIEDELDPLTGEPIRMLVKLRTRGYLDKIKEHCHYSFKPIYSKLILPIITLADLGYSNNGEQFKFELEELRTNEQVKRWYSVTQLCEAMLPVKYYEDPSLGPDDVVVITKKEAAELDKLAAASETKSEESSAAIKQPLVYEPQTNSMVGLDSLGSVSSLEAQKLVDEIKSNLSARDRVTGRAIMKLLRNIKNQLKSSRIGRFFFSKPKDNEVLAHPKDTAKKETFELVEVSKPLGKSLEQADERELMKLEGASSRVVKSSRTAKGVGKRRRYQRKGDVDMIQEMRMDAVSYKRTKTWSEIFAGWGQVLSALTPSRTKMIIVGSVIVGLLVIIVFCTISMASGFAVGLG